MKVLDKRSWKSIELEIVSSDDNQITFIGDGPPTTLAPAAFDAVYKPLEGKTIVATLAKVPSSPLKPPAAAAAASPAPSSSPSSPATVAHVRELHAQIVDVEEAVEKMAANVASVLRSQLETLSAQVSAIFKTICEVVPDKPSDPKPST
jgi:hypothetical protein